MSAEITKDNLSYCKEVRKVGELRHLDGNKGNFGVSKKEYTASASLQEATLLQQIIYSNVKEIVEQQQYLFESFWKRAIPAETRIKEIEEGIILGDTEVIQAPLKIQELFLNLVRSAKEDILLILPTINAFYRIDRNILKSKNAYITVRTIDHQRGEIQGQILPSNRIVDCLTTLRFAPPSTVPSPNNTRY